MSNWLAAPFALSLALSLFTTALPAGAQDFPNKPIRLVTPVTAGTVTDVMARYFADQLKVRAGWTVLVDNKPGGDFIPSALSVIQAPADGYSVYHMAAGLTILPATRKDLPWDLQRDFHPLARPVNIPVLLTANPSLPANNLTELIAYAKANPGKLSYGGIGTVSPTTLAVEYLKQAYALDIVLVPYKDGATMTPDLLAGRVMLGVNLVGAFVPHIKDNKLKPITLFGGRRTPALPNVQTSVEATSKADMEITSWTGFAIRSGAPKAVSDRLEREIMNVMRQPETRDRLLALDYEPVIEDSAAFAKRIESDLARFGKLIRDAKLDIK
jgi:tripartite-type tricarboxylate transporter receptor subunit TctC